MPRRRSLRRLCLLGIVALVALPLACHLDMLLQSTKNPHPVLAVVPTEVRDSARAGSSDTREVEVAIMNNGGRGEDGSFKWSASDHSSWMRLSPNSGDIPDTLTITLDPKNLAPGVYQGDVTVMGKDVADTQFSTISVTFIVQRPGLTVTPTSIVETTNVNSNATFQETLQISNSGTGELHWTATKGKPWVTLGATSGTGDGSLAITINSTGLPGGTYHDEVVITAPGAAGSPARIAVTLTVFAPGLAVNPGFIHAAAPVGSTKPDSQTLRVSNSGTGAITWSASKTQPWLSLSKTTGGVPEDVIVALDPTGLPPGVQRDTIVFTAPEATNGPLKVPVDFEIAQPGLSVTPSAINATAEWNDQKSQSFNLSISNSGGGFLAWTAGADQPWISLSAFAGFSPATLIVTVDPRGLSAGTYSGSVTVSSPGAAGSPATVPVQLVITTKACAEIAISPDVVRPGTLDNNDCQAPHRPGSLANIYGLNVNAGDVLSIRLTSDVFDPYLFLTDAAGNVLAQNNNCPGENGPACITDFAIGSSGHYLIEATSVSPGAMGALTITVIRERDPSSPQGLGQFHQDGNTTIQIGGTTSENGVVFKGRINDPNLNDSVHLDVELEPLGSPFTNTATQSSQVVAAGGGGTVVTVGAGGLTANTGYHWQVRTCDRTGRCSAWLQFGNNAENTADFSVAVPGGSPPK